MLASGRIVHSQSGHVVRSTINIRKRSAYSSGCAAVFVLCSIIVGCRHVSVPEQRGDDSTWHVQLDEVPIPRFRPLEQSADALLAQQIMVIVVVLYLLLGNTLCAARMRKEDDHLAWGLSRTVEKDIQFAEGGM